MPSVSCNSKTFQIAIPRLKRNSIKSSFCLVARTTLYSPARRVISRSTASSRVSGNPKLPCKKVDQFLVNLTKLHNLPMLGLQYDDLMTQLSTAFVYNP